jgi:hypothetical protein
LDYQVHGVSGLLCIDLGFGRMPAYLTDPAKYSHYNKNNQSEQDAFDHIKTTFNTLEIQEEANFMRLHDVCRGIITRVAELGNTEMFNPFRVFIHKKGPDGHPSDAVFFDVNVRITKDTGFYFDGKRIELFATIALMLRSPNYIYRAFTEGAFIFGWTVQIPLARAVRLTFSLKKVLIFRKSGHFKLPSLDSP